MPETHITVIVSLITAIAAILAPLITALINSRTSLKAKKLDIVNAGIRGTIAEMTEAYSSMTKSPNYKPLYVFVSAAYALLCQVADKQTQDEILKLINAVRKVNGNTNDDTDKQLDVVVLSVARYVAKS